MMVVSAVVMGLVLWGAREAVEGWSEGAFWQRVVALAVLIGLGLSVYFAGVLKLGATSLAELKSGFSR